MEYDYDDDDDDDDLENLPSWQHPPFCTCQNCEYEAYLDWWNNVGRFQNGLASK